MLDEIEIEIEDDDDDSSNAGGSWYSRAKSGGRTIGSLAILLASLFLLFWNEGFSKRHSEAIAEVAAQVVEAPRDAINPALEGKPVHLSASVTSQAGSRDDVFGLRTDGVVLYRQVQMYQWIEYEQEIGRGRRKSTEYVYEMDWDTEYHDSSQFHEPAGHQNPKPALESAGFFAADARFGPYKFNNQEVADQALDEIDTPNAPGSLGRWPVELTSLPELSSQLQQKRWYKLDEGTYYRGNESTEEYELGDLAATFYELPNNYSLSMISAQKGEYLEAWKASNGDSVLLASGGTRAAGQIINDAVQLGESRTKLLRIVGLIGAVIGAAGVGRLLGGFLGMIPVVGSIVQFSLMVSGAIFGLLIGLITIAVGWLSARPWISAVIMTVIIIAIVWAVSKGRNAEGRKKRLAKVARVAAVAKQRAIAKLSMPAASMGLATAGVGAGIPPPPPPPPGSHQPSRFTGKESIGPLHPIGNDPSNDLAPLEWTSGLATTTPPAVKTPPPKPLIPSTPLAARKPNPFDADDNVDAELAQLEMPTMGVAPPAPPHSAAAAPARPTPVASVSLFDSVETRPPAGPLFDDVGPRLPAAPLFDTVEPVSRPKPLFDDFEPTGKPAPLFDTVKPYAGQKALFDDDFGATKPTPLFEPAPAPRAPPAPVAAPASPRQIWTATEARPK